MSRRSAVVVGGGVTGLAVAHRLLVLGKGKISVTVLEAQARTGGELALHTCGVCQMFFSCEPSHRLTLAFFQSLSSAFVGWVKSRFQDGILMEEGSRSLRVAGNGATTLKLISVRARQRRRE